jgi:hypothetical protein
VLKDFSALVTFVRFQAAQLAKAVGLDEPDGRRKSDGRSGHICHGPYITLGPGRYTAGFYVKRGDGDVEGEFEIEACNEQGKQVFAKRTAPVADLFSSIAGLQHIDFTLDATERGCELRLFIPARTEIEVSEAVLFRSDVGNWGPR